MTHIASLAVTAEATFGRDGAMFEGLLGFVAQLSLVLWGVVIFTAIIRFVGIRIYRRGGTPTAAVETVAPSSVVPAAVVPTIAAVVDLVQPTVSQLSDVHLGLFGPTAAEKSAVPVPAVLVEPELDEGLAAGAVTNAGLDGVLQHAEAPAAVAMSVKVPRTAHRIRRAEHRSAAHAPALAANSEA